MSGSAMPPHTPAPADFYTEPQRRLQQKTESEPLADTVVMANVRDEIEPEHAGFITSRDFFFLSSVNSGGEPTVSYKGGAPGFVHVADPATLVFPNYDGNGMFLSMGNVDDTGQVGMLFIDMETPHRVRVQGTASLGDEAEWMDRFPGANMVVTVAVTSVFLNCGRYIHPHQRTGTSKYIPDVRGDQPYPNWKRIDIVQDSLPERDRGRADEVGGTITLDEYQDRVMHGDP